MYEFFKENMKYRCIATEDRNHFILVNHTPEEVKAFAEEHGFPLPENPEEVYYVVHESPNPTLFSLSVASLTRRLEPLEPHGKMFPWFRCFNNRGLHVLVAKGIYVGTGKEIPFDVIKEGTELKEVGLPHAE